MTSAAQAALHSWSIPIGVSLVLCLAAMIYLRGWFRLRAAFPNLIRVWRLAAFGAGIVSVWIAIGSPLAALDEMSLSVHMVQHLLLMAFAPPLLLFGAPALPLLRGLPQTITRHVASPFLRWRLVKSLGHFFTHPAVSWLAAVLALIGWHIPAVFALASRWGWLHELEHLSFFGTGLLFWWPVVRPWPAAARWPRWSIPLYLFCATLPCDALSAFLVFCDRVVYSAYLAGPRAFSISPLQDQQCAAALMWVSVTIVFLVPAVVVTLEILSPRGMPSTQETWAGFQGILGQPSDPSKFEVI
ncbi:MAG TPA: cytochrome c oxidase assembly protein [Candidatus Angelobacter sp.]|nr:cytochrome c oxidase assembly protein [Candidatus Angelobacter sp.]